MTPSLLLLLACTSPSPTDDSGAAGGDAGATDGGGTDAGDTDGGGTDSGASDGGGTDSGTSDSGTSDSGTTDGGGTDSGTSDGGGADSGDPGDDPRLAVVVNELMADNEGIVSDDEVTGDEDPVADWIELYNPGDVDADLSGCGISDDWSDPFLWRLPEGTIVPAGGHLLLWADGSALPGADRLPFRLSADGESLGLFLPDGTSIDWVGYPAQRADTARARLPDGGDDWVEMPRGTPGATNQRLVLAERTVVESGATWRYWDQGTHPGDDWTGRGFDDSGWASGPSPLGYGDAVSTVVSYGDDANAKHAATWFRTTLEIPEGSGEIAGGTLSVRFDDGVAVWLDGVELTRRNLPSGELTADTWATATVSGSAETSYTDVALDPATLAEGTAVLAAEVHQVGGTSSDIVFDAVLVVERLEVAEE